MIEEYKFGSITIDGKTYNHDVEVRWTPKDPAPKLGAGPTGQAGEVLPWRRKESHVIDLDDIKRALEQNPKTIIIGTGLSGIAKVSDRLKQEVESKGIQLIIDRTEQATKTFNIINDESQDEEGEQRKVIGFFHLTC